MESIMTKFVVIFIVIFISIICSHLITRHIEKKRAKKNVGSAETQMSGANNTKRGFEKGVAEGTASSVVRILTKRFSEVPPTFREKLYAIHDLDVLGQLTDVALDCQSLAEFEQALNK